MVIRTHINPILRFASEQIHEFFLALHKIIKTRFLSIRTYGKVDGITTKRETKEMVPASSYIPHRFKGEEI